MAKVVANEGGVEYAAGAAKKRIEQLGYHKVLLMSDTLPAKPALTDAGAMLDESLVGDILADGLVGSATKKAQGQLRAI